MHALELLRTRMRKNNISAYIIPSFDPHQSEYVAAHFKLRAWLTGFTGSAGTAVVTLDEALLWTDGRYHTQAENELSGSVFKLVRQGLPGEPTIGEWLAASQEKGATIGFDGNCYSEQAFRGLAGETASKGFQFAFDNCLLEGLWSERPVFPKEPVMVHELQYAGASRLEKIENVRAAMAKVGAEAYIIPNLDDIAWLMNLRGRDIPFCPFVISYLVLTANGIELFIHEEKLSHEVRADLAADGVTLHAYESVGDYVSAMSVKTVCCDLSQISAKLFAALPVAAKVVGKGDIIARMKSVKSEAELANIRQCQVTDGVAMVRTLHWLTTQVPSGKVSEVDVAHQLEHFRGLSPLFLGPSFNTIAGYGANAAMMHYSATPDQHAQLESKGFLLVDSGGQYLNGTTDITRTLALGPLTEEEKRDYTLTLKSHIGLAQAVFLEGTCGPHLDILARKPMWDNGLDYKCGTGHGIGYVLSVHEGPHTIRCNQNDVALMPGMLITNEPGVYKPGRHGIRIENTVLVVEDRVTEFGKFYRFETLSYCPIDTTPILKSLLTDSEIQWLNEYHATVFEKLSPSLEGEVLETLKDWTKAL